MSQTAAAIENKGDCWIAIKRMSQTVPEKAKPPAESERLGKALFSSISHEI